MTGSAEDFDRWLAEVRLRFGDPPRRVGWWTRTVTLWQPPPPGAGFADPQVLLFYRRAELLRTGVVTWGHIVYADEQLAEPGLGDGYVVVVFGTQPGGEPPMPKLREIAATLGTDPPDPREVRGGVTVPPAVAGRHPCAVSTLWLRRKHLPERQLLAPYFPLLVPPDLPQAGLVMPARYWPPDLVEHWTQPPA